jgi:hypothetical protein
MGVFHPAAYPTACTSAMPAPRSAILSSSLHAEVKSKLLVSGGAIPPTKANIEDALLLFREARPEDTVILFLAGHGVNEGADYLFMPEDAQRTGSGQWRPSSVVRW